MQKISSIQIKWRPDKSSRIPVYKQIVQFIHEKVATGEWQVGTKLPSQRALAGLFEVNRSTIITAIDELTSYGIVSGRHGAGTQISSNTWSLFLPTTNWNEYLKSGSFQENNVMIQAINELEFEPDIIRIGTGEIDPRLFSKSMWSATLQKVGSKLTSLGYLENLGLLELRQAIAKHLEKSGIMVGPENVLITSGSLQALQLIAVCLLQKGSTVFTEAPSYLKSLQMFQSTGMNLKGIPMDKNGLEYWKLSSITKQNSSILYTIPTNQNPTGITMSKKRRYELMNYCVDNRLPIIEDGAYQELSYNAVTAKTLKSIDDNEMVIYLGTASKTLAPGLRIGWVVASKPIVDRLGDVKMQMDYGASSLSQWALTEFLNSGAYDSYLSDLKIELESRRDKALKSLEKYFKDLANWNRPDGGFYIWLTFKKDIKIERLFDAAIKEKILLNSGDIYDFKENHSLRLSFAYINSDEFDQAIRKLSEIVKGMC
ncbi:MocR-like pyridoxine biosynthesis transcription factor PdxR [Companilactobacillus keshanensis]|uniref:PLP-dependent aminotransferase family protein n=1 Tax=Companilactobacillus keshanensis TaxID=2486003 RepID=A0ABW4BWH2_9LACO|nr:PLP-dependent aminotransferase family protein [Companilactobacillus keshanensis]